MSTTKNLSKKHNGVALLFLSPWIVGFLFLTLGPILGSFYLSLTNYDLFTAPEWAGLGNYQRLLQDDERYLASLVVTLKYVLFSVPLKLGFALLVAILLNRGLKGLGDLPIGLLPAFIVGRQRRGGDHVAPDLFL